MSNAALIPSCWASLQLPSDTPVDAFTAVARKLFCASLCRQVPIQDAGQAQMCRDG